MKRVLSVMLTAFLLCLTLLPASAAQGVESGVAGEIQSGGGTTGTQDPYTLPEDLQPQNVLGVPNVTVDDIGSRLDEKGQDIVYLMKIVGRYICLGAFILSCVFIIIGIIGNRKMLVSSLIGALISGVCYAAITCGEQIVAFIATWAAS